MPLISIIVPCYNLEPWIRACLDSVLAQSYADWECIVVDDESKDGSPVILDEYAARDSRVKVIHQKNAGEGGARNAGLAVAHGDWVFFLDGDDVMAPGALACLAETIKMYPNEDLIRFDFVEFADGQSIPIGDEEGALRLRREGTRIVDVSCRIAFDDYYVYVWQFLFRRSLIEGMKFDRYKRGADRTFIVPVLCNRAKSFVVLKAVCYCYRRRLGSAMNARASVQVLKDELSHRVDVVECIDKCGKKIEYCRTEWLEVYCMVYYLKLFLGMDSYTQEEQMVLLDWYYHELPRLRRAKNYSRIAKTSIWLYGFGRSDAWVKIVMRLYRGLSFARIVVFDPVRALRVVLRHVRCCFHTTNSSKLQ